MLPRDLHSHPDALSRWSSRRCDLFTEIFAPSAAELPSACAEQSRILSTGPQAGNRYTNEMAPYLVEIMDFVAEPWARRGVVRKSARVGYTEGVIGNLVLWTVSQDPCPIAIVQPSDGEAESYAKEQIDPLIELNPELSSRIGTRGRRSSESTMTYREFDNGFLSILGSASDRNMRRRSFRRMLVDEVDGMKLAGHEGDPLLRLQKRTDDYEDGVMLVGSTPTIMHLSRIDREFARSDQRYWHVPCPHCHELQVLEWGGANTAHGIKWEKELACKRCGVIVEEGAVHCPDCLKAEFGVRHVPETAHYQCRHCGKAIEEHQKPAMIRAGRWIATNPTGLMPGWHIDALISLFIGAAWPKLVQEFLEAKDSDEDLQVFFNTVLGLAWEERGKEIPVAALEARVEQYFGRDKKLVEVPDGVGMLTAFVDVQGSWLELLVRGWGVEEESWDILHERIHDDPERKETWARLEALLTRQYRHELGSVMRIASTLIDAGYLTETVYGFCRGKERRGVFPSLGDRTGSPDHPILKHSVRPHAQGVRVVTLGTYKLKNILARRLAIQTPGPRYMHLRKYTPEFCNGFDGEYYRQAGSEKHVVRRQKGRRAGQPQWVAVDERTEFIDCHAGNLGGLFVQGPAAREMLPALVEAAREGRTLRSPSRRGRIRSRGVA